jgi:diguanylate cyclase (GGDEF)-like protein
MLKNTWVPVVSLGDVIDGLYYAGIDNLSTIMELMDHMYQVHGCRKFLYAGGPAENSENIRRIEAFKLSHKKYGLPCYEDMILYGDYDYDTGVRYMKELYESGKELPDAIICANDNIATGICETAQKLGLHVPEDFKVTGFDNLEKAVFFRPQITTAEIHRERTAYRAMEVLMDIWAGKKTKRFHYIPSKCIYGESCGCPNNGLVNYRDYIKGQIIQMINKQKEDEKLMELKGRMIACADFQGIFREIEQYFYDLECDGFYIALDKDLFQASVEHSFVKEGYDLERMVVCLACNHGEKMDIRTVDELYTHLEKEGAGSAYMFTPIHFRDQTIGFTVLKNGRFLYDNPYFYDIHSAFVNALENLMKYQQREKMYQELKTMYNRDPMTGLYNRIAYTETIKPKFENYCMENISCALAFFDVDHFKQINDTMGHDYGDHILKEVAKILKKKCPEDGYAYRFGGDEFAVFFPNTVQNRAKQFAVEVEQEIKKLQISVSQGIVFTKPESDKTLDEYLKMADQKMYQAKRNRT